MSAISIAFGTPSRPHFNWYDSLNELSDKELHEFAIHCRSATAAFFSELTDRRKPWKDPDLEDMYSQLLLNADVINERGFSKQHVACFKDLYLYLAGPSKGQDDRNEIKLARQYLWLVSSVTNWSCALLILCSLGKHKLQKLDDDQRVKLIKHIVKHRAILDCPRLEEQATQCSLYQINPKGEPPLTRGCRKRMRTSSEDTTTDKNALVPGPSATQYHEGQYRKQRFPISCVLNDEVNSADQHFPMSSMLNDDVSTATGQLRANLLHLQQKSRDASTLLALLCFLDGVNIPEIMLLRAGEPQKEWGPLGEVHEVPVTESGFNRDVLALVSDKDKIKRSIELLEAAKLITSEPGPYYGSRLHIDSATQQYVAQIVSDPLAWRLQAITLVCHTFPMGAHIEPLYGSLGRLQIHQVQYATNHYKLLRPILSSHARHRLAKVLLRASYFLDIPWKSKALQTIEDLLVGEPAGYLQLWTNLRRLALTSLQNVATIEEPAFCNLGHTDPRSNALYGQMILSCVTHNIRRNKLAHARAILNRVSPLNVDCPSTMERLVLQKKKFAMGKLERYQGKFRQAQELLDVEFLLADSVTGRNIVCHLASVLCELKQETRAQELLNAEIKTMKECGFQDHPSGRRLRLSLAETLLQLRRLKEAEEIYLELMVVGDCPNRTIDTSIEKLRLRVGLARVSHLSCQWAKAMENWKKALRASEECGWKAGFTAMVAYYSISHVHSALGDREASTSFVKKAKELYAREGRQFWITGLGTSWLDFIWNSLGHNPNSTHLTNV